MNPILQIGVLVTAFGVSWIAVKSLISVLPRFHAVDIPGARSSHTIPTPTGGGVGIVVGIAAGFVVARIASIPMPGIELMFGASLIAAVGIWDDWKKGGVPIVWRLTAQVLAAIILMAPGDGLSIPLSLPFGAGFGEFTGRLFIILWVVAIVNFYNFLDGIDGFAGLQGAVAGLGVGLLGSTDTLTVLGLSVAGACGGFLVHNWQPARIFMGDAGSTTIGFLIAAVPLQHPPRARWEAAFAVVLFLWFFLADGVFTLLRRLLNGEKVWQAHRTHLYQRLVATNLSHAQVVLLVGGSAICLSALTVILTESAIPQHHWILVGLAFVSFLQYWRWTCRRERLTGGPPVSELSQEANGRVRLVREMTMNRLLFHYRRVAIGMYHLVVIAIALIAAFMLRFEFDVPESHMWLLYLGLIIALPAKMIVFIIGGMHHGWWRYVSIADLYRIFVVNVVGSTLFIATTVFAVGAHFPRSIFCIDFLLCLIVTGAGRVTVRLLSENRLVTAKIAGRKRILIYGAGSAAVTMVREIRTSPYLGYEVIGFLDDDPRKQNAVIMGLPVLGSGRDAVQILDRCQSNGKGRIDEIVIAMPSASERQIREAVLHCRTAGTPCKTIPSLGQLLTGKVLSAQLRQISAENLLNRDPVRVEDKNIRQHIAGQSVLVTGGAGSIGSELCRQIARFEPSRLIALDQAESELYDIDRELRGQFPHLDISCVVGDIRDPARLSDIIEEFSVNAIFHAAAYKHVPMMEKYPLEAIRNNVFGTRNLVDAAYRHRVSSFLMISSDKAVNPTSIMGATKRVTELIVSSMPQDRTKFVSVRFGNVLGSRGSAVPLFQAQIESGGPVTVTHPEMRRYFMTIPEAVQLVLLASTMGQGSEIFVLDMGEPIRIVDLARNLIRLAGRVPDQDIELRFVGIRPGEKLYEEVGMQDENMLATSHHKIKIFNCLRPDPELVRRWMDDLHQLLVARDELSTVEHLTKLVPGYKPDRLWKLPRRPVAMTATAGTSSGVSSAVSGQEPRGYARP